MRYKQVRNISNNLQVAYEDFKKEIQGKVILISDTDTEIVQYPTKDELKNLLCYRIVNEENNRKTILVKNDSNPVSPKTEIEDSLNGKLFFDTLLDFRTVYPKLDNIIGLIENISEEESYFALDLSPSKQKILEDFFNFNNNKFDFANKYVAKLTDSYKVPDWIVKLKNLYYE